MAIATLGFAEIIRIIFLNIEYVGGAAGMQVTHFTTWTYAFVCLVITILVIVILQTQDMDVLVFRFVKMK